MASKKNTGDKSKVISQDFLSEFTLITSDNLVDFNSFDTLFLVVEINGKKLTMLHSFMPRKILKKGSYSVNRYLWDKQIFTYNTIVKNNELQEDYDNQICDLKIMINNWIKEKKLYGKRV